MLRRCAPYLLAACATAAAGCYEVPPVIPPGYIGSPAAPGWPPLAVYDDDPFHPRNRWFHRAFSPRAADGALQAVHADTAVPSLGGLTAVDRAELTALLDRVLEPGVVEAGGRSGLDTLRHATADLLFRSDCLAAAARLAMPGRDDGEWSEVASRLVRAARGSAPLPGLLQAADLQPPPLRSGTWQEGAATAAAGAQPDPGDPRWTRLLRRDASDETVLLRLRVALDGRGEPLLLELASECWRWSPERGASQLWRFDRAEWLHGRDPWREAPGDDVASERGRHLVRRLREPADSSAVPATQAEAVRAALAALPR